MADRTLIAKPTSVPAKISPPQLAGVYERRRLFRALDIALRKRVVWIAAPAGAGKTSVVTTYLATRRLPALWFNVDARDADVANLFHYLATAVRIASRKRKVHLPTFTAEHQAGAAAFARSFFEALSRERPVPSVIVLDDYHEARSVLFDQVLREALCALPKGISAVIMSRTEPPPLFARLLASGEIALIGADELRLTQREMTGLIRLHRPDLCGPRAKDVVRRVIELANGWAAALTLLLQDRSIDAIHANGVDGSSERLFDYFATEILDKISPAQRDFLLKTSVLPSFTSQAAERLTGATDSHRILVDLERRSFFTQRLGSSGAYRYHPLLRGFLSRRAEVDLGMAALRELHRRAAESLVEEGQIDEAMDQFETAEDVDVRAELILHVAHCYVAKGQNRTVERWIARLPVERVERDGWLLYWDAVCCLGHSPSRARERLERSYATFAGHEDAAGLYRSCAAAIQAIIHEGMDFSRLDPWVERLERLHAEGPACPESFLPIVATGMMMAGIFWRRDPAQARYWAERALALAIGAEDVGHRLMTGGLLAFYLALQEDPAQAAAIVEMLRASARAAETSALSSLTVLQADAVCAWVRGDNALCLSLTREALALASQSGVFVWNLYLHTLGVAAALGSEDADAAREFLDPMALSAQQSGAFSLGSYHFNASWEAVVRGDTARALHSAELARQNAALLNYPVAHCIANLVFSHALWQAGRADEARAALAAAREQAEDVGSAFLVHGCDLSAADFWWDADRERALSSLRSGLAVARRCSYQNMFCMGKSLMARNAVRALEHRIETEHVRTSILKHRLAPRTMPTHLEGWFWRYHLRALGRFELTRGDDRSATSSSGPPGERQGGPRGMPLRLLQAIVAFGARSVRDVALVDALWPDAEGDAGRRVFDTTLHRLRRQLGDDEVLRLNDGRVSLDERLCWVDVWALEHVLAEAGRVEAIGSTPVLVDIAHRLLAIYRGPLLANEAVSSWARDSRERMASKFLHAVDRLGQALEQRGEFRDATALYERVLEGDDLAERAYAGLMRCAAGVGHRADAQRIFEQLRAKLSTKMDAEPGPELTALRARLTAWAP